MCPQTETKAMDRQNVGKETPQASGITVHSKVTQQKQLSTGVSLSTDWE